MTGTEQLLTIAVQITILVAAGAAGTMWLRRWIAAQVVQPLEIVHAEINPNDGKSLGDAVHRIEASVGTLSARFADHLAMHNRER